jgi:hypothetical protein
MEIFMQCIGYLEIYICKIIVYMLNSFCVKYNHLRWFRIETYVLTSWCTEYWSWTRMFVCSAQLLKKFPFVELIWLPWWQKPITGSRMPNKIGFFLPLLTWRRNLEQLPKSCGLKTLRRRTNSSRIIMYLNKLNTDHNNIHLKFILILSFHPRLGFLKYLFPSDIRTKIMSLSCVTLLAWDHWGWHVVVISQNSVSSHFSGCIREAA